MNLSTWFKGLGVFVLSSCITALATMTLDPASFNFSRSGLAKLAAASLIFGVKAVLLYLKQSPLPGGRQAGIASWTKVSGALALCVILPASGLLGCVNSWEHTAYASLAASKAVIDCAVAGYNHFDNDIRTACAADPQDATFDPQTFYLPRTQNAQSAVEKARQAQVAAVEAFAAYAVAKVGKDPAATLEQKQAAVITCLHQLPALVNALRELMGKNSAGVLHELPNVRNPIQAVTALRPKMELVRQVNVTEVNLGN